MIIKVKVYAGSRKNEVVGFENQVLKVKCTAIAEKGKANAAVIKLLSKYYKTPKKNIILLKGHTCSNKVIEVRGI